MTQVCRELAARVADGVASVGAAMKRGTGLSQASKLGESRGRAPEGERAPSLTLPRKRGREKEEGARREPARAATLGWRGAVSQYAPFGAPPPLMCLEALVRAVQIARASKTRRENGKVCPLPLPAGRERETFACPPRTGGCRICNPWPLVVGVRRCESFASATENWLGIAGQNDGPGDNNHA